MLAQQLLDYLQPDRYIPLKTLEAIFGPQTKLTIRRLREAGLALRRGRGRNILYKRTPTLFR